MFSFKNFLLVAVIFIVLLFACDLAESEGTIVPPIYAPDTNADGRINLSELMRVVQFFNMNGYHACPDEGTEDGFCPGPAPVPVTIDLAIGGLMFVPEALNDSSMDHLVAEVTANEVPATHCFLGFYLDGQLISTEEVLPNSQSWLFGARIAEALLTPGNHVASIVVDLSNQVAETNESNNGSTVNFNIPSPLLAVPDLTGMTLNAAQQLVETSGLTNGGGSFDCSNIIAVDLVMGQNPTPGTEVAADTLVSLVLSTGPCVSEGEIEGSVEGTTEGSEEGSTEGNIEGQEEGVDLTIADFSFSCDALNLSIDVLNYLGMYHLYSRVKANKNISVPFRINFYFDNELVSMTEGLNGMHWYASANIVNSSLLTAGQHTAEIIIDADSQVEEIDESNNSMTICFEISREPRLLINEIIADEAVVTVGDAVGIEKTLGCGKVFYSYVVTDFDDFVYTGIPGYKHGGVVFSPTIHGMWETSGVKQLHISCYAPEIGEWIDKDYFVNVINDATSPTINIQSLYINNPPRGNLAVSIAIPEGDDLRNYLIPSDSPFGEIVYLGTASAYFNNWIWDPVISPTNPDVFYVGETSNLETIGIRTRCDSGSHFRGNFFAIDTADNMAYFDLEKWAVTHNNNNVIVDDGLGGLVVEFGER